MTRRGARQSEVDGYFVQRNFEPVKDGNSSMEEKIIIYGTNW